MVPVASTGIVLVATIALGAPAGGAPQPTTSRPDPVSAAITHAGDVETPATVVYCFDQPVGTLSGGTDVERDFYLQGYDNGDILNPEDPDGSGSQEGVTVDPDDPSCVLLTFGTGSASSQKALALYTLACAVRGAGDGILPGSDAPARPSVQGCVRLDGSSLTYSSGKIAGPNLVSTSVDEAANQIEYTFDRPLDNAFCPTGAGRGTGCPQSFGFYDATGVGGVGGQHQGVMIVVNTADRVTVQFDPADDVGDAVRIFAHSTVRSRTQDQLNQTEHRGESTEAPELISADRSDADTWTLTYDRPVTTSGQGGRLFSVYTVDGSMYTGSGFLRPIGEPTKVRVPFEDIVRFRDKVVRLTDEGCAVRDAETSACSTVASFLVGSANSIPGYTDGPELRQVILNTGDESASFLFDQNVHDGPAYAPPAGTFALVDKDAELMFPPAGATAQIVGTNVRLPFTGQQLARAVGASVFDCAVYDYEGKPGLDADCNPIGYVGMGSACPIPNSRTTCPPLPTSSSSGCPPSQVCCPPVGTCCPDPPTCPNSSSTATSSATGPPSSSSGTGSSAGTGTGSSSGMLSSTGTDDGVPTTTRTTTGPPSVPPSSTAATAVTPRVPTRIRARSRCRLRGAYLRCTTTGTVGLAGVGARAGQAARRCSGRILVQVKLGRRTISARRVRVGSRCTFDSTVRIRQARVGRRRTARIAVRFLGNSLLRPSRARVLPVRFR